MEGEKGLVLALLAASLTDRARVRSISDKRKPVRAIPRVAAVCV